MNPASDPIHPTDSELAAAGVTMLRPRPAADGLHGLTVGRGSDCAIALEECADLSRRHFSVRPESGAWLLEDLGSRNGTISFSPGI